MTPGTPDDPDALPPWPVRTCLDALQAEVDRQGGPNTLYAGLVAPVQALLLKHMVDPAGHAKPTDNSLSDDERARWIRWFNLCEEAAGYSSRFWERDQVDRLRACWQRGMSPADALKAS